MEVHAVERDQFLDCGLDGKSGPGPALVMAFVAMAIRYGNRYAGDGTR
jgi:hypothetical protein